MANVKILEKKQEIIDEIADKVKASEVVVFAEYQGLSVEEMTILRRQLRDVNSDIKIYKNTLAKRALDTLEYDMQGELEGPKVMVFGTDIIEPIKILSKFAKEHPALLLKIGIVDKEVVGTDMLSKLASTPSRDELLTMLAAGLIEHVRNFAIGLNLYAEQLNDGKPVETEKVEEPVKEETVEVAETVEETSAEATEEKTEN